MGVAEIEAFLTHLAVVRKLAASTQNQAFAAILFFVSASDGDRVDAGRFSAGEAAGTVAGGAQRGRGAGDIRQNGRHSSAFGVKGVRLEWH